MSNEKFNKLLLLNVACLMVEVVSIRMDMVYRSTFGLLKDIVVVVLTLSVLWSIQKSRNNSN
jgi:hypothetical protein